MGLIPKAILFLGLIPLATASAVASGKTSCPLSNLNTLQNILMILCCSVEQDKTTRCN